MLTIRRPGRILALHADGVVRDVGRQQYRADVLPSALEAFRTDPDRLARVILTALESGYPMEVLAAAERLHRIDPNRNRRYWLFALVLGRNGKFKNAESVILRYRDLYGDSVEMRAAHGEILLGRNLKSKGEAALRSALELDPNYARALRALCDAELQSGGADARNRVIEEIAMLPGAWRAQLLVADLCYQRGEREQARALVAQAVGDGTSGESLDAASAVMAAHREIDGLLELVAPRYDPSSHGARCGVNLLYAHLDSGRKADGEALLAAIASRISATLPDHLAFYRRAFAAVRPETANDRSASVGLHKVIAATIRNPGKSRSSFYQSLMKSVLLLPVSQPWADVPLLADSYENELAQRLEPVTAIDSQGREVALAFTTPKALAQWSSAHRHWISFDADELLRLAKESLELPVIINAAGPASAELSPLEIAALVNGTEPPHVEHAVKFVAEPLRTTPQSGFVEALRTFAESKPELEEAYLFELVDEARGATPAAAIYLSRPGSDAQARELVLEAQDRLEWKEGRRKRTVRFLVLQRGPFLEYVRFAGYCVIDRSANRAVAPGS